MPRNSEGIDLVSGSIDWSAFFAARPELNPPGYDETVERMGYRKQQVGDQGKDPAGWSVGTQVQMLRENVNVREQRKKLGGLPPEDHTKQPKVRH